MSENTGNRGRKPVIRKKLEAIGIDQLCLEVAECFTLRKIAKKYEVSMPSLLAYLQSYPDHYARAMQARADNMAEEIIEISDEKAENNVEVQQKRLRVDTRKWLMSKMLPKKYGEKLELDGKVDGTTIVKIVRLGREDNEA